MREADDNLVGIDLCTEWYHRCDLGRASDIHPQGSSAVSCMLLHDHCVECADIHCSGSSSDRFNIGIGQRHVDTFLVRGGQQTADSTTLQ